jgi:hypothetical protein
MKKSKVFTILLILSVVFLILNVAFGASQHSKSSELVQITKPFLQIYASAYIQPNVSLVRITTGGGDNETDVTGTFKNNEDVDVFGVATATVTIQKGNAQKLFSDRTRLPAQEEVSIKLIFVDLPFERYYSCLMSFAAEPLESSTEGETGTQTTSPKATASNNAKPAEGALDFGTIGVLVIGFAAIAAASFTGVIMFRKTRLSEQKVRRFTSYEYQDLIMKRLGGHSSSVSDSRKGIDGFTSSNVPVMIKQSDSVGKLQVQNFMNAIIQLKARNGIIIAFGFDGEAQAAASRARMNRIDIKLVTVKELIEHKETVLR